MSSYTVLGIAYVRRYKDGEEWDCEEIDCQAIGDCLYNDTHDDVYCAYDGWRDLPEEEGMYVIQFVFKVSFHADYWGEVDADYDVEWEKITLLTRLQELEVLNYHELITPEEQDEREELIKQRDMRRMFR